MAPTIHPDATAFAARFLAHPSDRLGRLVFADWLDERDGESNTAWAQYLRCMAQVEVDSDGVFRQRAESLGRAVRAWLTLSHVPGIAVLPWLTAFLPELRIWVRIGPIRIPPAILDYCQENFARLYRFMPIGATSSHLFIVVAEEEGTSFGSVHADVENYLCCRVTAFRGFLDDISRVIDAHHGRARLWLVTRPMMPDTDSW